MDNRNIYVPLFSGQGAGNGESQSTRQRLLRDASTPTGQILLRSLHRAFRAELSSLSQEELIGAQIDLDDFQSHESLVSQAQEGRYSRNPIMSNSFHFLVQSLRYLVFVEDIPAEMDSLSPFSDALKTNLDHGVGVLGFSSGILMACVVASSSDSISYIARSVEVYRLAVRIGIRSQMYQSAVLRDSGLGHDTRLPWSVVISGLTQKQCSKSIEDFLKACQDASLYITAIMDETCLTVSGRPDHVASFLSFVAAESPLVTHHTALDSLYHSAAHLEGIYPQILNDARLRQINFPEFSDLILPVRSTADGHALWKDQLAGTSLLDVVLKTIITQPVRWDLIRERFSTLPIDDAKFCIVNVGPGSSLWRSIQRSIGSSTTSAVDLTISEDIEPPNVGFKQLPIAIVGMAINMPGAPDVEALWKVLEEGINTVSEIPEDRFSIDNYPPGARSKHPMKARRGHFIESADMFDNKFFNISPREAKNMDPQQRILLHTAYDALDDAGYVPNATPTFRTETFGCYIGAATNDYVQNIGSEIDVYYSTGTLKSFLSGRISHAMQFGGPSVVVDTACSSSLVAIHQGARALSTGDCNAALVGGVNIITSPEMFMGLDRGHFLSPTGASKPFDASADGYVRGEGCGVFILKRLSDAIAEHDRIWGVIRAVEVNQSGMASSITHPHVQTQTDLFKRVLESSGLHPNEINVVEAHGTGTQAGDPSELESIRNVFARNRSSANPLHITSGKANTGHLEAASGAGGLAKLLLMLKYQAIPRQISLNILNPRITPLTSDHSIIDFDQVPWDLPYPGSRRAAVLNSFGAAGSNAALVVQEYTWAPKLAPTHEAKHFIFAISAKDESSLETLRSHYIRWLQGNHTIPLSDIAYSATARRRIYNHRIAVSTHSTNDLMGKLTKAPSHQAGVKGRHLAFVFSGQGSQYLGMGQSLYQTCQFFRQGIDHCNDVLVNAGFPGCLSIINPVSGSSSGDAVQSEAYQTALVALQYSLAQLWVSWGVKPSVLLGHSLGEYAALAVASVISIEDALLIAATRARLMFSLCDAGVTGMLAVHAAKDDIEAALHSSSTFHSVTISCENGSNSYTLSGTLAQLRALKAHLDGQACFRSVLLDVPFGYHSNTMEPIFSRLDEFAQTIRLHRPTIPIVSNVSGLVVPAGGDFFNSGYFARHCMEPVRFDEGLKDILTHPMLDSIHTWVDIGSHPQTNRLIRSHEDISPDDLFLSSLRKSEEPWETLTTSLARLYNSGFQIDWRKVFDHISAPSCINLPGYPFSKSRFWIPYTERCWAPGPKPYPPVYVPDHPMLHTWTEYPYEGNGFVAVFQTPINRLGEFIIGHCVGGVPLCPASVYLEQVFGAVNHACLYSSICLDDSTIVLRHVEFPTPLVYEQQLGTMVTTKIIVRDGSGSFVVTSGSDSMVHAKGDYQIQSTTRIRSKFDRITPSILRQVSSLVSPSNDQAMEVFYPRTVYEVIFPRVVTYSPKYRLIETITVHPGSLEGCARVSHLHSESPGSFHCDPLFLDVMIHTAGFIANLRGAPNDAYICAEIGAVKYISQAVEVGISYDIFCNNFWVRDDGAIHIDVFVAEASSDSGRLVALIKDMQFRQVRLDRLKRGLLSASRSRSSSLSLTRSLVSTSSHDSGPTYLQLDVNPGRSIRDRSLTSSPSTLVTSRGEPEDESVLTAEAGMKETLRRILASVLEVRVDDLEDDVDLVRYGLDSLSSIEAIQSIQVSFEVALHGNLFVKCKTIEQLYKHLESYVLPGTGSLSPSSLLELDMKLRRYGDRRSREPPITLLQTSSNNRTPLFLIHDGSGMATHYSLLDSLDREVWGIGASLTRTVDAPSSLLEMAESYATLISERAMQPILVGGWSFGGVVAYETALRLARNGVEVAGILLIDSPGPAGGVALSDEVIRSTIAKGPYRDSQFSDALQEQLSRHSRLLERHQYTVPDGQCPPIVFLRSEDGYCPNEDIKVPAWLADRAETRSAVVDWESLTMLSIPILDIPGNHFQAFDLCHLPDVTVRIDEACLTLEKQE